jgi:hypothetical protein
MRVNDGKKKNCGPFEVVMFVMREIKSLSHQASSVVNTFLMKVRCWVKSLCTSFEARTCNVKQSESIHASDIFMQLFNSAGNIRQKRCIERRIIRHFWLCMAVCSKLTFSPTNFSKKNWNAVETWILSYEEICSWILWWFSLGQITGLFSAPFSVICHSAHSSLLLLVYVSLVKCPARNLYVVRAQKSLLRRGRNFIMMMICR